MLAAETSIEPEFESAGFSPFGVVDYLQMASFASRDLVLEVQLNDGRAGRVVILGGEVWSCRLGELRNLDALEVILEHPEPAIGFRPLTRPPNQREITTSTSGLLLELSMAQDESRLLA